MKCQVAPNIADTAVARSLEELVDLAPGTAYVERVAFAEDETLLTLRYPFGRTITVRVVNSPRSCDHGNSPAWGHPIAVHVRNARTGVRCSVVGASRGGARRTQVNLMQGLMLTEAGVHTVFVTERAHEGQS